MLRKEAQALQHRAAELVSNMKKDIAEFKHLPLAERKFKAKGVAGAAMKCNMLNQQYSRLSLAASRLVLDAENAILNDTQVRSQLC